MILVSLRAASEAAGEHWWWASYDPGCRILEDLEFMKRLISETEENYNNQSEKWQGYGSQHHGGWEKGKDGWCCVSGSKRTGWSDNMRLKWQSAGEDVTQTINLRGDN